MSLLLKISSIVMLFSTLNQSYAANIFPRGCLVSGHGFNKNYLVLNEHGDQTIYFMQNRSNAIIELEHVETRPNMFMSPKLESKLLSGHWSAFASDTANTYFKCYKRNTANGERVVTNCQDNLDVCQYARAKFALSNMGNYWVSTDKPLQQVIQDATKKGIYLKW